jgi:predicted dithiol-disulfide oxidoreductase (DUF899 family)
VTSHRIGTREQWAAARAQLVQREKELTRMGDEAPRQGLPCVLGDRRQLQRRPCPPAGPRRDDDMCLSRPDRKAARLPCFLMGFYAILDRAPNGRDEAPGP